MTRLLIGEGKEDALRKILELLNGHLEDCHIATAVDGMACLRAVEDDMPDVIVLDADLPILDGIETCQALKESRLSGHIPILLLVPSGEDVECRRRGLAAGADDYLALPFDSLDLVTRVKIMLRIKRLTEEISQGGGDSDKLSPFLAHKLRSPLNSIIGMAELIQKPFYGELNEKQRKFVEIISSSGYRLVEFINEHAQE